MLPRGRGIVELRFSALPVGGFWYVTTKMRPIRSTIALPDAKALIDAAIAPVERTERIPLGDADGRVLAEDVVAAADVPPFARAAMDGYAVRAADTAGATREHPRALNRIGTVFTGEVSERTVAAGECLEIATGAPMPAGADAVLVVEETDGEASGRVLAYAQVSPGQNIGRQGADITQIGRAHV